MPLENLLLYILLSQNATSQSSQNFIAENVSTRSIYSAEEEFRLDSFGIENETKQNIQLKSFEIDTYANLDPFRQTATSSGPRDEL